MTRRNLSGVLKSAEETIFAERIADDADH